MNQTNQNEIEICYKFEPLFELLDSDSHNEVDTVVLTGGRGSTKSFNVASVSLIGVVEHAWKVLYSRFTNTSIGDSIKLEVSEKIEILNYEDKLIDNKYRIESNVNDGFISFKGIKTGSKGQTANLKSLSGFNVFVVDEAEEIPSYDTFKKVFYSIRSSDKRNISILILNPTTKEHWIYKELFEKKQVPDGFCGIVDNVMYIHTSYLDVKKEFIPKNIRKDYERLKIEDPVQYENVVLGGWISEPEGVLFKMSGLKRYKELPIGDPVARLAFIDPADSGTDAHSVPVIKLYSNGRFYLDDVLYTELGVEINVDLTADILNRNKPEYVRIEVNMGGGMYPALLQPKLNDTIALLPFREKSNKHARIYTISGFIKEFCYFKDEFEYGTDYYKFMHNLTQYMADGTSAHDDAPDSLAGLANMVKSFYANLYEV